MKNVRNLNVVVMIHLTIQVFAILGKSPSDKQ